MCWVRNGCQHRTQLCDLPAPSITAYELRMHFDGTLLICLEEGE